MFIPCAGSRAYFVIVLVKRQIECHKAECVYGTAEKVKSIKKGVQLKNRLLGITCPLFLTFSVLRYKEILHFWYCKVAAAATDCSLNVELQPNAIYCFCGCDEGNHSNHSNWKWHGEISSEHLWIVCGGKQSWDSDVHSIPTTIFSRLFLGLFFWKNQCEVRGCDNYVRKKISRGKNELKGDLNRYLHSQAISRHDLPS